jgi:DNA (cytosine-5)-methyltransferase 1
MDPTALRYLSVFSGIEAATVAWHPLGWTPVAFSEIEKFPSAVLAHHYPDVPNLGDMTTIDTTELGRVDVLVGGSPCQAFSVAGMRLSLADARGNLTLSYVRLAHELADGNGLRIAVWENVPGVLSTKDNAFGCFLGALVGHDSALVSGDKRGRWSNAGMVSGPKGRAAWRVLDAQYFGVAQRRRRVFVVADFGDCIDPAAVLFESEGVPRHSPPSREARESVTHAVAQRLTSSGRGVERPGDTRGQDPVVALTFGGNKTSGPIDVATACNAHGGPSGRMDFESETFIVAGTLQNNGKAAGSATQQDAEAGLLIPVKAQTVSIRGRDGGATAELGGEVATALRASQGGGDKPHVLVSCIHGTQDPCSSEDSGQENVICFTSKDYGADAMSDLSPTLRAGGHSDSHANAGVPPAIAWSIMPQNSGKDYKAREVDVAQPLMAAGPGLGNQGGDYIQQPVAFQTSGYGASVDEIASTMQASYANLSNQVYGTIAQSAVRRLTPRECERLQGFPDDYTLIPVRGKSAADGPRYKALGNSMAVPCMAWIGRRIAVQLAGGLQ